MSEDQDAPVRQDETYAPSPDVTSGANVPDYLQVRAAAGADPVAFWTARARELVDWYEPFTQALDASQAPFYRWFADGKTNIALNALDRHMASWRKNKQAFIWE